MSSLNIFLTQNLFREALADDPSFIVDIGSQRGSPKSKGISIPELCRLHCRVFRFNQDPSNIPCSPCMYQRFVTFLDGQVLDIAGYRFW